MTGSPRSRLPRELIRPRRDLRWLSRLGSELTLENLLRRQARREGSQGAATQAGGPPPPPGSTGSSFPEATGPVDLALNTPLYFSESKYGRPMDLARDAQRLGVAIHRHPGRIQLFVDHLLFEGWEPTDGWTPGSEEIPAQSLRTEIDPIARELLADDDALYNRVASSFPMHYIVHLCTQLTLLTGPGSPSRSGPQLILTFLDYGQGSDATAIWAESGVLEDGELIPTDGDKASPVYMPWADDNFAGGEAVVDPITGAEVEEIGTQNTWNQYSLDPSSPYKRVFYARLAQAVGRWLTENEDLVSPFLAGIEIGNEVEAFHTTIDTGSGRVVPDGESWGDLYFECARAMRHECTWVPIWLPGLASYAPDKPDSQEHPLSWGGKMRYLREMLDQVSARCAATGLDLCELVQGVDLHYYHMGTQEAGSDQPQALANLAVCMRQVRELVITSGRYDWTAESGALRYPAITCIENSTNVMTTETYEPLPDPSSVPAWMLPPDLYPVRVEDAAVYDSSTPSSRRLRAGERPPVYVFDEIPTILLTRIPRKTLDYAGTLDHQGQMVWMRLAVAMLSGATVVGWHGPIGVLNDAFEGTGLRYDQQGVGAPASEATARPAWWALREFGRTLASATAVRLMAPTALTADTERNGVEAFDATDMLWVIEFEGAVVHRGRTAYAYLVFLDPYWPATSADPRPVGASLDFACDLGSPLRALVRPTWPSDEVISVATSEGFPLETWPPRDADESISVEARSSALHLQTQYVALGRYPLLVFSDRQLRLDAFTLISA